MVKLADMLTRRKALIAARTGLAGLGGASLLAALNTGEEHANTEAKKRNKQNRKGSAKKKKKKRRERSRRKKDQRRKRRSQHDGHGNDRGKGEGIQLETGSVISESLITKTAGRLSAHMLLPFEEFPSEEKLAEAVAEGEELNLFILPDATDVAVSP